MNDSIYDIAKDNNLKKMEQLVKKDINLNTKNESGMTLLHLAIAHEHEDMALLLLEHGANGSVQDDDGFTSLHYAVEYNMLSIAKIILKNAPKTLHIENKYGNQPLWVAVINAHITYDFTTYLLGKGADKNHLNKVKSSPYTLAKSYNVKDFLTLFDGY